MSTQDPPRGAAASTATNTVSKDFNYFFRQDILRLFKEFNSLDSYRFTDFAKTWTDMKFYQILSLPKFFPFDYRFFMKDTLKITAEYLYDKELDEEVRAAALYTIYALYVFQMNRPRLKIPVSPKQWTSILEYVKMMNEAEHVDVEYVFRYLLYSDAFEFCSSYELKYRNIGHLKATIKMPKMCDTDKAEAGGHTSTGKVLTMAEFKNQVFADEVAENLGTIHEAYLQFKEELAAKQAPDTSLSTSANTSQETPLTSLVTYINTNFKELLNPDLIEAYAPNTNTGASKNSVNKQAPKNHSDAAKKANEATRNSRTVTASVASTHNVSATRSTSETSATANTTSISTERSKSKSRKKSANQVEIKKELAMFTDSSSDDSSTSRTSPLPQEPRRKHPQTVVSAEAETTNITSSDSSDTSSDGFKLV